MTEYEHMVAAARTDELIQEMMNFVQERHSAFQRLAFLHGQARPVCVVTYAHETGDISGEWMDMDELRKLKWPHGAACDEIASWLSPECAVLVFWHGYAACWEPCERWNGRMTW
jgi:hypothetical protein